MTNEEIISDLVAKGVPFEAVIRVMEAFRAEARIKRRNAYAREWAKKNKATEAA